MSSEPHDLAAAYSLDAVDRDEALAFEQHLATCETCATDVREMRETAAALAVTVAEPVPSGLRERTLALARSVDQLPPTGATVSSLADRGRARSAANRWLAGVAAAAVLVAGALGVATYQANQRADDAQVAAKQISAVLADPSAEVEHGDVEGGGTGTLVTSPALGEAVFLTEDLPEAASNQTYQLWAIDQAGATSIGLLQPDAGHASELLDLPADTTTFGMTVEPAGGSDQPTTEPILLLDLPAT